MCDPNAFYFTSADRLAIETSAHQRTTHCIVFLAADFFTEIPTSCAFERAWISSTGSTSNQPARVEDHLIIAVSVAPEVTERQAPTT